MKSSGFQVEISGFESGIQWILIGNERFWRESSGFQTGIQWILVSKPVDSAKNPVDSRSEMNASGPEMNASAADLRVLQRSQGRSEGPRGQACALLEDPGTVALVREAGV